MRSIFISKMEQYDIMEEYMHRLATIVKAFNKLTAEEKLELKNWLANTLSEEIKDVALSIFRTSK